MGNLCSSGTERADKKDENRVLDKPREGEGEALLPGGEGQVAVGPDGVQLSVEGDGGGEAATGEGGFGGFLGGAVKSGESAFSEVSRNVEEEGQRATANAFQAGKDATGQVVEEVQTSARAAVTEAGASVQTAVQESVTRGIDEVKTQATEVYQSATGKLEGVVGNVTGSLSSGVASVAASAENEAQTLGNEAGSVRSSAELSAANIAQQATSTVDSAASSVQTEAESLSRNVDTLRSETASVATEAENLNSQVEVATEEAAVPPAATGFFGNVKEEFGRNVDEAQTAARSLAENVENTAENKANEVLESARLSASEAFASWGESAQKSFSGLTGSISSTGQTGSEINKDSAQAIEETASASSTLTDIQQYVQAEADVVGQSVEDVKGSISESFTNTLDNFQQESVQGVEQFEQSADDTTKSGEDAVVNVRNSFGQSMDQVREYVQDITTASSQKLQELSNQTAGVVSSVQDTTAAEADSVRRSITEVVGSDRLSKDLADAEVVSESSVDASASSQNRFSQQGSSDIFTDIQAAAKDALSGEQEVREEVVENLEDLEKTDSVPQAAGDLGSDESFLDKARTLLEAHRNSLDGNRIPIPSVSIIEDNDGSNTHDSDLAHGVEGASQEATAREFVESIIEKATSLVTDSLEQKEPVSESSSPSDPCVERGEETLAPKKRGVMFVSPQMSERSSSSLSSAQDISPPPPHESDLSPPGDSSSSSISQSDLVEAEELLIPPSAPADYSLNESNNNNNNIINNNVEDDDESIQRVAMEVTAKAVQDAIKIVAENGTGTIIASDVISNDVGVSSPSSPDNDEEETTTDSSQVERGSPVSDLTDTSAHGSVSESLSSYDPGAVFRQDVASLSDLASSPGDQSSGVVPPAQTTPDVSQSSGKAEDLIDFGEFGTAHEETPTPTNSSSFDTPSQHPYDQSKSEVNPSNPFSSEVPSSLPPLDEQSSPSSPNKPMIIINSPDSAQTNGSSEDVSSPQNEALI
ncbi:unnamed protein product [Candidula unifasciata]|uniref:Uncharacterized protein n=1 Tax=Candidula unifasciata TaxID=100452 RepID=A0A8S4A4D1_9EUPU|nr:unnamed protein product [Candidula unifasciata]